PAGLGIPGRAARQTGRASGRCARAGRLGGHLPQQCAEPADGCRAFLRGAARSVGALSAGTIDITYWLWVESVFSMFSGAALAETCPTAEWRRAARTP